MLVTTAHGVVRAARVVLATNAFRPLLRRLRLHTVPVYDYVLMTEPLSADQLAAIGWRNRQGIGDTANQFHYYRLTADNRILWGGYDAIYHYGRQRPAGVRRPARDLRQARRALLHDVPPAGRAAVLPPVGRRDRHLHAVLRVPRHRVRRPGRLLARVHRARRRR